jgi:hypothetical protein
VINNDLACSCTNVMLIESIAGAIAYVMIHHRFDGTNSGCLFSVYFRSGRRYDM